MWQLGAGGLKSSGDADGRPTEPNQTGGDVDRRLFALDDTTGAVVWKTILSGPVSGHAISYAVGGRQYIAVPAGGDTASPEKRVLSLHPEIKPPQGQNAIFVFALPAAGPAGRRWTASGPWVWLLTGVAAGVLLGASARRRSRSADRDNLDRRASPPA
ncbi:MAG: PQQ-binding-like beta-propeller repeat protein [Acidobacteria bacterium]|nr:PQQ-binding-like beta-propeller repeat protein [Acidobacteriota bacterium]